MGDRVTVVFTGQGGLIFSPGVYAHWRGNSLRDDLKAAAPRMTRGDQDYSAARFCGYLHTQIPGNEYLGLRQPPPPEATGWTREKWWDWGPGDRGVVLVDTKTGICTNPSREDQWPPLTLTFGPDR